MVSVHFANFSQSLIPVSRNTHRFNTLLDSIPHSSSLYCVFPFSVLTLLVGWQEGHPACKKTERWGAGVVICLERAADLHMPSWCHCHSLSLASVKSRLVFTFLVPAHPGSPGKRAVCVLRFSSSFVLKMRRSPLFIKGYLTWLDSIVLFFSRPRSEGWPHHGRTFYIYRCPLSFWLTLPRGVLSTSWCCPVTNSTVCSSISIEINISMYSFSRVNGNKFLSCF